MAFARAGPEMVGRRLVKVVILVTRLGHFYSMRTPDGVLFEGSLNHLVHRLHRFLFTTMADEATGAPILHAATVRVGGSRMILFAHKAAGKSTLAAKLLEEGWAVEGDENVAVFGLSVLARPRTLRIKRGTIDLVPALRDAILGSPFLTDWDGRPIYSVEPCLPGRRWQIEEGRADVVVFLEQNHGGRSVMEPMRHPEALQRAIRMSYLPATGKAAAVARLHGLVTGARCYRLSLGDLDNAVWHLRRVAYDSRRFVTGVPNPNARDAK
jgi:hypothetical protein